MIVPFAKKQGNKITIHAARAPVRNCIQLIAKDFNLNVDFK